MRAVAAFAAVFAMAAAPLASAGAEETGDIYSKNGVQGPSFSRATHCAAIFATALNATQEGSEDYNVSVKIGTAWLTWARQIADGRDADGELNNQIAAFNQSVSGKDPEGASAELGKEIKACQTIKTMMASMEPFASVYNEAVTGKPAFNTAIDCATTYSVIAQSVGEKDENYKFFNDGVGIWSKYAEDIYSGNQNSTDAGLARAQVTADEYTRLLTNDKDAGIARLVADRDKCTGLEPALPKYFKNR